MTEKQLYILLKAVLTTGLTDAGGLYASAAVKQAYQQTKEGRPSTPVVLLSALNDHRYGFVGQADAWDAGDEEMDHIETQDMESLFQVGALWPQPSPSDTAWATTPTADDLVNLAARILSSAKARETMRQAGVFIYRITDVRRPYMAVNDQDNFEPSPSFDFTATHQYVDASVIDAAELVEGDLHRV